MKRNIICHIVSWYPSTQHPNEAIWTKLHIAALREYANNYVFHIQVKKGKFKRQFESISNNEKRHILFIPTDKWIIKEFFTTLLVLYVILFKAKRLKPDYYNFQITYPLLTHSKLIQFFARKPIIVTEHWSAYHNNFGVTEKPNRIKRIFKNKKLRFLTVSNALATDIETFSETKINYKVVPNIVDTERFHQKKKAIRNNTYVMVSYWKDPKNPFVIFDALAQLELKVDFKLIIIGDGPLLGNMKGQINQLNLQDVVEFTGRKDSDYIANALQSAAYLIHCSEYETASVVCMEALCCGTPILASSVGGIKEYTHSGNSITVTKNNKENWKNCIYQSLHAQWNYEAIALEADSKWNANAVGLKYYNALTNE